MTQKLSQAALSLAFDQAHEEGAERHGALWLEANERVIEALELVGFNPRESLHEKTLASIAVLNALDAVLFGGDL